MAKYGVIGLAFLIAGIFVLLRRRYLAKTNAKNMVGWRWWTDRFDYSEEYFTIANTVCGVAFILFGVISLAALFKDPDGRLPVPLEYLVVGVVGFLFIGGLISIIYVNIRFRKTK